jgi:hypothetical protein
MCKFFDNFKIYINSLFSPPIFLKENKMKKIFASLYQFFVAILNDGVRALWNTRPDQALLESDVEQADDVVQDIAEAIELSGGDIGEMKLIHNRAVEAAERLDRRLNLAVREEARETDPTKKAMATKKMVAYTKAVSRAKAGVNHAKAVLESAAGKQQAAQIILLDKTLGAEEVRLRAQELSVEGRMLDISDRILDANKRIAGLSGIASRRDGIAEVERRQARRRGQIEAGEQAVGTVLSVRADAALQTEDDLTPDELAILAQAREAAGVVPAPAEEEVSTTSDPAAG